MSNPPDSAWLDALLGGTDGVEIPPQSQGVGSTALSQMYRDAAMLEQESLALAAESQKRRFESEMPSAVPKMAKRRLSLRRTTRLPPRPRLPGPKTPATEGGASGAVGRATGPATALTLQWP